MTNFDSLTGTFAINNGVVANNDLLLQSAKFKLTGQGSINLITTGVNYQVKAANTSSDKLDQIVVPIKITGTFNNLSYKPDFNSFLGNTVNNIIKAPSKSIINIGRSLGNLLH
jgi:AsmA protein